MFITIFFYSLILGNSLLIIVSLPALAYHNNATKMAPFQHMTVNITQFPIPVDRSWPLYPLFDEKRNVIWIGDTVIDSGRIWEFKIANSSFNEHKLFNTSIVTMSLLDANETIWYLDPLLKKIGNYIPKAPFMN